jgi:uncharacterized protein (TIGR02145 family)
LTLVSGNGTSTVKLKATTFGIHPGSGISCTVTNACGSVTGNSSSDVTVVTPANLPLGPGSLKGRVCFDIAETVNDGTINRGDWTLRLSHRADFTNSGTNTQTYTFTARTANVGNIRFIVVDNDECVESTSDLNPVTGPLPNGSSTTLTVNYKTTLNQSSDPQIKGRGWGQAAEVMIYAVYNNGSNDVAVPLEVEIRDCLCCGALVAANTWKNFMCHNLGADESADPFTPTYATNGAYYQWGHKEQAAPAPTDENGSEPAFTWSSVNYSGYFGDNTDTGNATAKSDYDPCPSGYRVPSYNEWDYLRQNNTKTDVGIWTNSSTGWAGSKFGEGLILPAAGARNSTNGTLEYRGYAGVYWSTRRSVGAYAHIMIFYNSNNSRMDDNSYLYGFSVRCIEE